MQYREEYFCRGGGEELCCDGEIEGREVEMW